ncbi:DUF6266 family protein [Epilithonimonas zeae]|uniref:DUF6266 family protein n=1 Tax=Epilithonimonas zeae TaxID=1416779 RepID=UPI00200E89C9|nr:DUF6266 family protein [Epilithonimonas zeae]
MGKLYDSLLSGTSGRTGRIVVANVSGNEISRVRPKKRSGQPTVKQLLIQNRMKKCALFMQSYRGYACKYFGTRTGMKSSYNLAMTNLMENFKINFADATITPNYPMLSFSKGNLLAPVPLALNLATASTLEVTWQDNSAGNTERENDFLQILVAIEEEDISIFVENAAKRADAAYTVNLPVNFQNKPLHIWMAFRTEDGEMASNSQYAGTVS